MVTDTGDFENEGAMSYEDIAALFRLKRWRWALIGGDGIPTAQDIRHTYRDLRGSCRHVGDQAATGRLRVTKLGVREYVYEIEAGVTWS